MRRWRRWSALLVVLAALVGVGVTPRSADAFSWMYKKCTGFAGCDRLGYGNAGYEKVYKQSFWLMYGGHNCTNYVAYRMSAKGMATIRVPGQDGNATNWGPMARMHGWQVNSTPSVGSVAWFSASSGLGSSAGHVAYVESIQGNMITVSEDNWQGDFDWRQYYIKDVSGFIHFQHSYPVATSAAAPRNLTPATPKISGTTRVGRTITATPGTWKPTNTALSYQWLRAGAAISKATGKTYTLVASDLGKKIQVKVTGKLSGYTTASRTSAATTPVEPGILGQTTPVIVGTPTVGRTLTAAPGSWTPSNTTLTYQWRRNSSPVKGATKSTYALGAADQGARISVTVTGTSTAYQSASRTSSQTSAVALGTLSSVVPTITGTAQVGQTLTSTVGSWAPSTAKLSYQWLRDGTPVAAATGTTYKLTAQDVGATVQVAVTGILPGYRTLTRTSASTGTVAPGTISADAPAVAGTTTVGSTLTATIGTWSPGQVVLSYQWLRGGQPIAGATGRSYVLQASDQHQTIAVRVTGTLAGYLTQKRTSASSQAVAPGTFATSTPVISGTAKVGLTLTAATDGWKPGTTQFTYQWLRGGKAISGATGRTYQLVAADQTQKLSVRVTGRLAGYTTATLTSATTSAVAIGTITSVTPVITGTARVGQTLQANAGTWSPSGLPRHYQWLRNNVPIAKASARTYTVTPADLGTRITLQISVKTAGYTPVIRVSSATASVASGQLSTTAPSITGDLHIWQTLTGTPGAWGPSGVTLKYQWLRDGKAIPGATGRTYVLQTADHLTKITFKVTGSKSGYTSVSRSVTTGSTVLAARLTTEAPVITGQATVGGTLRAEPGAWGPKGVRLTYQWVRGTTKISGATGVTYKVVAADKGQKITVQVTGRLDGYATETRTPTAPTLVR